MNKEVAIAIFIGIALGIAGAGYINRESLRSRSQSTLPAVDTIEISGALPSPNSQPGAKIAGMPESFLVYTKPTLSLNITPQEGMVVVFETLGETSVSSSAKPFTKQITLKPGYNEVILGQLVKKNDATTTGRFFYLPQDKSATSTSTEEKATSEAEVIKQRLEQKVLELRYNAKKAVYGTVVSITPDQVEVETSDGAKKKIKLEPEVTRFSAISARGEVSELDISDITKGDMVTVFISTLADEEKSYTVYQEPDERLVVGKIAEVNSANYQVSLVGLDKSTKPYDVESSTIQEQYDADNKKVTKGGFSQLSVGAHVYAVVKGATQGTSLIRYLVITAPVM